MPFYILVFVLVAMVQIMCGGLIAMTDNSINFNNGPVGWAVCLAGLYNFGIFIWSTRR